MPRWMLALLAVFAVVYVATVLISGSPEYLIPGAILLLIILGYAALNSALTRRELARHGGDRQAALRDDEDWAIPSAHLVADDDTAAGDTPEVHDEISPHDLPIDHPGREAAEQQAAQTGATRGNGEGAQGGRSARGDDETDERAGESQRSAPYAKSAGGAGTPGSSANDGKTSVPGQKP
jgi:hypothetical protein